MAKVSLRSEDEVALMRKSGEISAKALKKVIDSVKVGITLEQLDQIAEDEILKLGGGSSFKTVPGYFWTTCINVNDGVVHGIPTEYALQDGDTVIIDLGAVYKGWHTDLAWTLVVGKGDQKTKAFLQAGEDALWQSIKQVKADNHIGDISSAIQNTIESSGYNVIKSLTGHGVGRKGHEEPEIPTYGKKGQGLLLQSGMTLAIEAIYAEGSGEVYEIEDGWTIVTQDKSRGAVFEMTVLVTEKEAEVLTDWRKV